METLKDVGDWLKEQLPDVTPEKHMARGELESPSAGGADWGLRCIHCLGVKNKIKLDIGPSLVDQWKGQALEERTGPA